MKNRKFFITLILSLFACLIGAFFIACGSTKKDGLTFKTLSVEDTTVYGKVSNATTEFSFIDEVTANGSVEIPDSVTSIDWYAFYGCSSLKSIMFKDTSTWYITHNYTIWQNKTGGTETSVTTPSDNATYFTDTYSYYYWYKL